MREIRKPFLIRIVPPSSHIGIALSLLALPWLAGCQTGDFTSTDGSDIQSSGCYDRSRQPQTALVDSHVHFRPFGGEALAFEDVVSFLERTGVRYANVYGIGQVLPAESSCRYYLDCPGTPVRPSLRNDIFNAVAFLSTRPSKVRLALSMTFADLADPASVLEGISVLDREFPGLFMWMGEVNLVKQAQFANGHLPVPLEVIADWAPFMKILRTRDIPLSIHSDLGNDAEPTKYLTWMQEVLRRYPENKIVWMHLGLSRELTRIDPELHIKIMSDLLEAHPRLMLDLSWGVLDEAAFTSAENRRAYLPLLNEYSNRFLPGTDFVASSMTSFDHYARELHITSRILSYLDDEAFQNIALGDNYFRFLGLDDRAPEVCRS